MVINFDMPMDIESYIHRIGRTGRKNQQGGYNKGTAISLVVREPCKVVAELVPIMRDANQEVSPELADLARMPYGKKAKRRYNGGGGGYGGASGSNNMPLGKRQKY